LVITLIYEDKGGVFMVDGTKIRELRLNKGMTSLDVSNLSKNFNVRVSKSYLEELERGDKHNPSFNVIETIAIVLGVSVDELRITQNERLLTY
jgi:transcriptional regulator with XRE-family HTH domain